MDRRSEFAAGHLGFCLAEMMAEIEDQLSRHAAARALEQLDARETAAEPVTAVDAATLRAALVSRLAAEPLTIVRRKLLEINALLTTGSVDSAAGVEPAGNVADLAAFRQEKRSASQSQARPRTLRRVAGAVGGLAMLALASLASIPSLGWISRSPGIDILTAISPPHAPAPASHVGIADAH